MPKKAPLAFSYLRFSTPEQMQGDSFRRQSEAAERYAAAQGLTLSPDNFHDLGVSGYHGDNVRSGGALGAFLAAIESGAVPKGAFLLVENLDRLSRQTVKEARNRFESILDAGVNIHTLADGKTYWADSYDTMDMVLSLLVMERAHEESATKGMRRREAWKAQRAAARRGEPIGDIGPAWIDFTDVDPETGEKMPARYILNEKAETVRRIFAMTLEGVGKDAIMRTLNAEGVPSWGKGKNKGKPWSQSSVRLVLNNPASCGIYQPMKETRENGTRKRKPDGDPIKGYFPAAVSEGDFFKIQKRRPPTANRGEKVSKNVFRGVAHCAGCGSPMHFIDKGAGHFYLDCDGKRRHYTECNAKPVPYWSAFTEVMHQLEGFRHQDPNGEAERERRAKIDNLTASIDQATDGLKRLLKLVTLEDVPEIEQEIMALKGDRDRMREEKRKLEERQAMDSNANRFGLTAETDYIIIGPDKRFQIAPSVMREAVAHISSEVQRLCGRIEFAKGEAPVITPPTD